jgi:hypothetical protein
MRDLWSIAQFDFGLSLEEFGRLTPGMFQALQERRQVQFRHHCLYAGIVASTLINIKLPKDSTPVSPYDFFVGASEAEDESERELEEIKKNIVSAFSMFPNPTPDKLQELHERSVKSLKERGYADAEKIMAELFAEGE